MKATLTPLILSLLLSAGMASCTQSEENDQANEIRESIEANEISQRIEKCKAEIELRKARTKERAEAALEELASTPEGRAQMKERMLIFKHCYVENEHYILKLSKAEALHLGISAESYDRTLDSFQQTNNHIDSIIALRTESSIYRINHSLMEEAFESARNGTHEYYKYLNKDHFERPDAPAIRDRN